MDDVLAHKSFIGNFFDDVFPVFVEKNNIINVRAVTHIFVLFQCSTYEAVLTIDIKFFVLYNYF